MWSSSRNFLVHGMWLTHLLWIQGRDNSSQNAVNGCSGSMMPSCSFIILIRHWNVHLYENCLLSYGSFHHSKPGCVWSPLREVHRNKMTCTKVVRPFREGNGKPLQYSCLENPMDGGVWWAPFYGVAKSRSRLSDFIFTFHFHAMEKEMATHSSVLAWRIPGTAEPGGRLKQLSSSSSSSSETFKGMHGRRVPFKKLVQHPC